MYPALLGGVARDARTRLHTAHNRPATRREQQNTVARTATGAPARRAAQTLWIMWHVPSSMLSSDEMSDDQSLSSALGVFGCAKTTMPFGRSIFAYTCFLLTMS